MGEDGLLCTVQLGWCPPRWRGWPLSLSPQIPMLLASRKQEILNLQSHSDLYLFGTLLSVYTIFPLVVEIVVI